MKKIYSIVAVCAVGALVLAGCSDDSGPGGGVGADGAPAEGATSQQRADVDLQSLVIGADELPAGYIVQEMPETEMRELMKSNAGASDSATIEPASCKSPELIAGTEGEDIGMLLSMKSADSLIVSVAPDMHDLDALEESLTGECSELTITINSGPAEGVVSTAKFIREDSPDTEASDALVLKQVVEGELQGQAINSTSLLGMAAVNGYSVVVMASGAEQPDQAAFDQTFVAAVNKVAAAT